ncbi:MAG: Glycine cleavage system H protein [Candidatus Heimdallarchaeota archaeon LC_3]|nr:MAG: Glycine cleavage system H protein [Candidatus Heimdallarchaeota archaeon LC_3]
MSYNNPDNLLYHKEHEWVQQNDDGTVTIGISDYAQQNLTDIVYAGMKVAVGDKITLKQVIGEVESVKSVSDIYNPIAGEVVEVNEQIGDAPESINSSPYEAWFLKIKPDNFEADKADLMDSTKYAEYCASL